MLVHALLMPEKNRWLTAIYKAVPQTIHRPCNFLNSRIKFAHVTNPNSIALQTLVTMAELKRKRIQIVDNSHQFKPFFWELEYITIAEDHPAQR